MIKIGIMQPYFFPYIGYFQLINAVGIYVNLDHVSFMKRSYMTRNTLKDGININIPVSGGSQNKTCREVNVLADDKWFDNFIKTLDQLYKNEPNYCIVMDEVLAPWYAEVKRLIKYTGECSISLFNFISIAYICNYLDMNIEFIESSEGITNQKREKGLQEIVNWYMQGKQGGVQYINAIGGQSLYTKEDFASQWIDLKFIKNKSKLSNTSILDLLFRYDKEVIKRELNNYELI